MREETTDTADDFEFALEDDWPRFKANEMGYMARRVPGLAEGYFVKEMTDGSLHIVEAELGTVVGRARPDDDGRYTVEGYWAREGEDPSFHPTGRRFRDPRRALLGFNLYLSALREPSAVTLETYVAFGGKPEDHLRATLEKRERTHADEIIGRSYHPCRGPHRSESVTVVSLADVSEGDRYVLEASESGRRWTGNGELFRHKLASLGPTQCACAVTEVAAKQAVRLEEASRTPEAEATEHPASAPGTPPPQKRGRRRQAAATAAGTVAKTAAATVTATTAACGPVVSEGTESEPVPASAPEAEAARPGEPADAPQCQRPPATPEARGQFSLPW